MNKISMSMLMGVTADSTARKMRPATVKKLREMRQNQRLSLTEIVAYNVLWTPQYSDDPHNGQGIGKEAQSQNFSDGGVCLMTQEPLKRLEVVHLNLFFSHLGVMIPTIGEVVWTGRRSGNGLYRIGLRYLL